VWNILENEQLEDQEGVGKIDIKTNLSQIVRSEVFTVVKNQVKAFWVVMPSSVVVGYQCFRGPCCLHLQVEVTGYWKNSIDIGLDTKVQQMPLATLLCVQYTT
jgi:hypothetical protein